MADVTDPTPEREMNRALDALRLEVPVVVADDVAAKCRAALDAERARNREAQDECNDRISAELGWDGATTALQRAETRYLALVAAARDLCNQETDTYPELQKALADVDAGRGGIRLEALRLGCEAALAHAEALRVDTPENEVVRLKLIETLRLALAAARLDANEDTEPACICGGGHSAYVDDRSPGAGHAVNCPVRIAHPYGRSPE